MIDSKLAGTGNSRFLKSVSNFKTLYPTYDDFVAALIAGTLPIDLNGINPDGWTQQGTPLNKANLLSDDVANGLGLVDDATPNGAFNAIISAKGKSNGFATLDSSGKVPSGQLPSMDYIPTSQKGVANGVASLDENGLVPKTQISYAIGPIAATFNNGSSGGTYISGTCNYYKTWNIATIVVNALKIRTTSSMDFAYTKITGLPNAIVNERTTHTLLANGSLYEAGATAGVSCLYRVYISLSQGAASISIYRNDGATIASGKDVNVEFRFDFLCDE